VPVAVADVETLVEVVGGAPPVTLPLSAYKLSLDGPPQYCDLLPVQIMVHPVWLNLAALAKELPQ
jgi:hypothetical protein